MSISTLIDVLQRTLSDCYDLRRPRYRGNPHPLSGHCYVASEALFHVLKGLGYTVKPMFIRHEGEPHWYLQVDGVGVVDPTAGQFTSAPDYSAGRGRGFLTTEPSKRAETLLQRVRTTGERNE